MVNPQQQKEAGSEHSQLPKSLPRRQCFAQCTLKSASFHLALVGGQLITIPPHPASLQHGKAGGRAGLW